MISREDVTDIFNNLIQKTVLILKSKIISNFVLSEPIDRSELKEIASDRESIHKIRAVPHVNIRHPSSNVPSEISRVYKVTSSKENKYCYGLKNVKLWGSSEVNHIILYGKRRPILETTHNNREMLERYVKNIIDEQGMIKSLIFLLEIPPFYHRMAIEKVDSVFDLAYKPNYYSWLTLVLPKLEVYEKSHLTDNSEVLVYDGLTKFEWADQSLDLLGIGSESQKKMERK